MSRFNQKTPGIKTRNFAGGQAYRQEPELALVSILLTSFAQDQYYRSAEETFSEIRNVLSRCEAGFAAKAAVFARREFGMRSISHVVAAELAPYLSGQDWAKDFYQAIIHRPDDMTEILSYYHMMGNKNPTNAMKKGFQKAFDKFDRYQLAKYRGDTKAFKLVDVVNLVRPIPNEQNKTALRELINGSLRSEDTWEARLTQAGQEADNEAEKARLKAEVWKDLLTENKLGYFALIRNLANILEQAPDMVNLACEKLVEERAIKRSLVLPFRFATAIAKLKKLSFDGTNKVIMALNKALDISCVNVPNFPGKTLVVLDDSGSMQGKPARIGSLFSAILVKANLHADFMQFSDNAKYVNHNPQDSTLSIADSIRFRYGGTNFHSIFETAAKAYDRIIILSDMQGWVGYSAPTKSFREYCARYQARPFVYSFDLQGYGTMQFPEDRVFCLAGFSEKVFDVMQLLEENKQALIRRIRALEW